jgi:hypothetical protein
MHTQDRYDIYKSKISDINTTYTKKGMWCINKTLKHINMLNTVLHLMILLPLLSDNLKPVPYITEDQNLREGKII